MDLRPRRLLVATAAVLGGLVVTALAAIALGADALSLVIGAAVVAAAMAVLVGLWLMPLHREQRRSRGRHDARRDMRRLARRTQLDLYHQLEALLWLRDELDLEHPLPATRGFAAAPDTLLELVRIIDRTRPRTVVDLGSGVSTVVMARRLQQLGGGRLVAVDHSPEYAELTRRAVAEQGLEDVASVVVAPLTEVTLEGTSWRWYGLGPELPASIDLLFVDGPPGSTGRLARYPAVPQLRDRLSPGATVVADDGARTDETEVARRWAEGIEGSELRYLPLTKGAWVLRLP